MFLPEVVERKAAPVEGESAAWHRLRLRPDAEGSLTSSRRDRGRAPAHAGIAVLEIGCGPGAAARAVAARLTTGHILAIDRSAKAIAKASTASVTEMVSGRMSVRQVAAEDFAPEPGEDPITGEVQSSLAKRG